MASTRSTSKRHISFYNKEYTSVCSGINLKSRCTNTHCESVRSMGGLVIVKCPDLDTCVYQDVVYDIPCPSCGTVLSPQQFSAVVFVRCEAKISIAGQSELLRASQEETVLWQMEYLGPEIMISVLERESEKPQSPFDASQNYLIPTNGVNLVATCRRNDCVAFKNNQGIVIVRVGLIGSAVFQELVKFRNCPSCNHELDENSFSAVTFLGCRAEVEIGGKVETLDATSLPKCLKIEADGPQAVIHVNRDPITPSSVLAIPESEAKFDDPILPYLGSGTVSASEVQEKFENLLRNEPALKESTLNDFGFGELGLGDLTLGGVKESLDKMLRSVPSGGAVKSSKMEPGINFMADCPSSDCGSVVIPSGHIVSCKFIEAIRGITCPFCQQALPPATFTGVAFLHCKASVQINEKQSMYQAGLTPEICKIPPEELESEISVLERDAVAESTGQLTGGKGESYVRVCPGLNIEAMCINTKCDASMVVIQCPEVDTCRYYDLIQTLKCPSCSSSIPLPLFIGISFVKCHAEVTIGSEFHTVEAKGDETKDFGIEIGGPPVMIKILSRGTSSSGQLSGNSGKEYTSGGTGLNIIASCYNPACLAFLENDGQVIIKSPDSNNCLLSDAASNQSCPSCGKSIDYYQVKAIVFVRCSGEVIIGDRHETFRAAGDHTADFLITPNDPEVIINISTKVPKKDDTSSDRKYTKVCDGVNFSAFCENPDCLSVREYSGFVNVKRDEQFIQRGGYPTNRCNYCIEIQNLNCPSCGSHLDPKIVRGVALVRCKGMIEIAGKSLNFEAIMNNFERFNLDHSDMRTFVEYEVVSVLPYSPGLNVVFRCPNTSCPGQKHHFKNNLVFIKFGTVTGFKVNEVMLTENCPVCKNNIPIDNIEDVIFNKCTAVVRIKGKETNYLTGSRVHHFPFEFRDNIEVNILPVIARDVLLLLLADNPFFSLIMGLNVEAICSNQGCAAKLMHEGRVCISCPQIKHSKLSELLSTLSCPSCNTPMSELFLVCLSFVQCKALLQGAEKKYFIQAASDEVINFEGSILSPDFSIQVLSLDESFPGSSEEFFDKGSEYSHSSLCHGLSFRAICTNPTCEAVQNNEYVNIMSGHLLDFDYRLAVQSLICSSCTIPIQPGKVKGVTIVFSTGEVRIGERVLKFDYSGDKVEKINIPNDGSDVWIKVEHRTYDILIHPIVAYMLKPFQTVCKGLNFHCYCKNPLCSTVKQSEGIVNVQRDTAFANAYGYAHDVCNYYEEISNLKCPDCSKPLPRYFVWGVLFSSCSGIIKRNGSPPQEFCTLTGKVILYALDRDDTSARIEFSV